MTLSIVVKAIVGFVVVIAWGLIIWAVETHAQQMDKIRRAKRDVERAALKQAGEGRHAGREIIA